MIESARRYRMDPEVKAKFVKALRSGAYKQSRYTLKNDDGYCCLGVLCEVIGLNHRHMRTGAITFGSTEDSSVVSLPKEAQRLSGLSANGDLNEPAKIDGKAYFSLVSLNDNARLSFGRIADIVEEQF